MRIIISLLFVLVFGGCANNPIEQVGRLLAPSVYRSTDLELERKRLENELLKAQLAELQGPSQLEARKAEIVSALTRIMSDENSAHAPRFKALYRQTHAGLSRNDRMLITGYAIGYEIILEQAQNQPNELSLPQLSNSCAEIVQTMDELSIRGFRDAYIKLKIAIDEEIAAQAVESKRQRL